MKIAAVILIAVGACAAEDASREFLNHGKPLVDAHNAYPYNGRWADRIDRAAASG